MYLILIFNTKVIKSEFFLNSSVNEFEKKKTFLGRTVTSVSEEKTLNPRLTKPREDFIKIMNELGLPYPKKIGKMFLHISIWRLFYLGYIGDQVSNGAQVGQMI